MKKVFALAMSAAITLTSVAALADNVVKIGVFEPASGDNGAGGKQEVLGIEYANSLRPTVSINGTEYTVELVEVDNQSLTDKAVTAAQDLVDAGVSIVLGSYGSGVSMAGGTVFEEAGIPAIGISCTNPAVTSTCDYYWRICFLDPFQGSVMANFADSLGCKKAYVLSMLGDDYTTGLAHYFVQAFKAAGYSVVEEAFTEGTSDFTAYLNNAVSNGCDVIFAPSATTYASLIIDQAAAQNITFPILSGDTWDSGVILEAAKGKNVKVYNSTFFVNGSSDAATDFVAGYPAWLNANADKLTNNGGNDIIAAVSALGFDAYNVALAAIEAAGTTDSEAIAEIMPTVEWAGVTGNIVFDAIGDAAKDTAFIEFANPETGAFDFVKAQN